jgi:tetratricopeptide (TPR) repeat protein
MKLLIMVMLVMQCSFLTISIRARSNSVFYLLYKSSSNSSSTSSSTQNAEAAILRCKAAREKNASLDDSPNGPSFCLGLLMNAMHEYAEAIDAFQVALAKCPSSGLTLFHMGKAYEMLLRFDEAKEAYNSGIVFGIRDVQVHSLLIYIC